MDIYEYLSNRRDVIISAWIDYIFDSYPKDAGKFLPGNKSRFANPIGYGVRNEVPMIFDELRGSNNRDELRDHIEVIIKIRAVQEFSTDEAVGFINYLKEIIRKEIREYGNDMELLEGYLEFESRIDKATGLAFDIYLEMKSKLYEIKSNEVKRRNQAMVDRLNRKYGISEEGI